MSASRFTRQKMQHADKYKPSTRICRVHRQYINTQNSPVSTPVRQVKVQGQRSLQRPTQGQQTWPQRWLSPGETSDTVLRLHISTVAHGPTNQERNAKPHIKSVTAIENLDISHYTTPYYVTNELAKASVKCLKTTAKVHHIQDKDTEHIRPLWVAQSQGSQILQTDCKVDTGAGCNILPSHRAQQLFGQE